MQMRGVRHAHRGHCADSRGHRDTPERVQIRPLPRGMKIAYSKRQLAAKVHRLRHPAV